MAVIETGSSTAGKSNVDDNFNAQVNLPYTTPAGVAQGGGQTKAGFSAMLSERDAGSVTGTRDMVAPEVTTNFRLRTATDQTTFNESFPGTILNSSTWTAPVTTSTVTVGGNQLTLNAGASLASGASARVTSYRSFPIYTAYGTYPAMQVLFTSTPVANCVHEWGAVIHSGTTAPTDGAYFTINASGEFRCVVNSNGIINQSAILNFTTLVSVNMAHVFLIYVNSDNVTFWIDNIKVFEASLSAVAALGIQIGSGQLPVSFRSYNTATVTGTAQLMKVAAVNVSLAEMANSKPWSHIQAGAGKVSYQGQTGQNTLGTTALYSNSLIAGAGTALSNAAVFAGSGLGGQFSVQPTLTIGVDGILSSYQVPTGSNALPGMTLYITSVRVQGVVTTVLANTGPVVNLHSIAYGHNVVTLAGATTTVTKAPVRIPLGIDTYGSNAPVGTQGSVIDKVFTTPIPVYPGEFIQTVIKNVGTVTITGVVTFLVTFEGYWE